jgi:hypothetical protein
MRMSDGGALLGDFKVKKENPAAASVARPRST